MRRALLRNVSLCTHHLLRPSPSLPLPLPLPRPPNPMIVPFLSSLLTSRFCSSTSDNGSSDLTVTTPKPDIEATVETQKQFDGINYEDLSNKELMRMVNEFILGASRSHKKVDDSKEEEDDEKVHPLVDAVLKRVRSGKHDEIHDELVERLRPLVTRAYLEHRELKTHEDSSDDDEFDRDLNKLETDSENDDLYDVKPISVGKFKENFLQVDDKKWEDLIKEQTGEGYMESMQQFEEMLEDMQDFDKLLPDEIKKKVEEKFEELGTRVERGELKPDEAYELFSKFEEEIINDHIVKTEAEEGATQSDETVVPYKTNEPPGEGPILRWTTRVVFSPGDNSWHPKNRKVKLSVTVKELGLTKHQFRRLRSLVGKRYHPGRDELTIISERFEHREENRKDCLRTLLSLIEEAAKAEKLVEDARASYVKERLKANPAFMERLNAKIVRLQGESTVAPLTSA